MAPTSGSCASPTSSCSGSITSQAGLAARFARGAPPIVLWEGVAVRESVTGAPLLADALGWIECRVRAEYDTGDHTFFVAEVVAVEEGRPGPALVYREHGYHAL